jgi:hypothetical protein
MRKTINMKMNIVSLTFLLAASGLFYSCKEVKQTHATRKHLASVNNRGIGMIYVDKISSGAVIKTSDSTGDTEFYCYLVGFVDSIITMKPKDNKDLATGKYYQYDMQHDWMALANGDSIKPVFFQLKQKFEQNKYEGILVFEAMKGKEPDTLVYTDSYGSWGSRQFIIQNNLK